MPLLSLREMLLLLPKEPEVFLKSQPKVLKCFQRAAKCDARFHKLWVGQGGGNPWPWGGYRARDVTELMQLKAVFYVARETEIYCTFPLTFRDQFCPRCIG